MHLVERIGYQVSSLSYVGIKYNTYCEEWAAWDRARCSRGGYRVMSLKLGSIHEGAYCNNTCFEARAALRKWTMKHSSFSLDNRFFN